MNQLHRYAFFFCFVVLFFRLPESFRAAQNNLPLAWRLGTGSTPKSLRLKAEKEEQKFERWPPWYTARLSKNGHYRKREWALFVFSIYRIRIFSSSGTARAGLTFSIAAACSLCPLQALRALTMFFFSNDSSFNGRTAGTDACPLSHGGIPLSNPSISSIGSSETSTERLILFYSSRTLPGHG